MNLGSSLYYILLCMYVRMHILPGISLGHFTCQVPSTVIATVYIYYSARYLTCKLT